MLWLRGPWDLSGKSKGGAGGAAGGKGAGGGGHAASGPAPDWTIDTLPGLEAYWVADDLSGSAQSTWASRVNSYTADQATANSRPTLRSNQSDYNGHKALEFDNADGTNDFLTVSTGQALMNGADRGCLFFVANAVADPAANPAGAGPVIGGFTAGSTDTHWPADDANWYESFGYASGHRNLGNPTPSLAVPRIVVVISDASDYRVYLDGTLFYTTGTNTVGFGTIARNMGKHAFASGYYFRGRVACIGIQKNLVPGTTEREYIEGALARDYGLRANLPGGHSFKTSGPTGTIPTDTRITQSYLDVVTAELTPDPRVTQVYLDVVTV